LGNAEVSSAKPAATGNTQETRNRIAATRAIGRIQTVCDTSELPIRIPKSGDTVSFGYHGGTDESRLQPHPRDTLKTLRTWIATGRHIDDDNEADAFCLAVLMNDLEAAIARADDANLAALPAILDWLQRAAGQLWEPGRAGRLA
jgi:hypothetical protein